MSPVSLQQRILDAISKLSDRQLQLVLQFIETLQPKTLTPRPKPILDPLANFIGATHHGNLARAIDETLYE